MMIDTAEIKECSDFNFVARKFTGGMQRQQQKTLYYRGHAADQVIKVGCFRWPVQSIRFISCSGNNLHLSDNGMETSRELYLPGRLKERSWRLGMGLDILRVL